MQHECGVHGVPADWRHVAPRGNMPPKEPRGGAQTALVRRMDRAGWLPVAIRRPFLHVQGESVCKSTIQPTQPLSEEGSSCEGKVWKLESTLRPLLSLRPLRVPRRSCSAVPRAPRQARKLCAATANKRAQVKESEK